MCFAGCGSMICPNRLKENNCGIAEIVEDIDDTRENPEEIVRLMFNLFYEYGGSWYK